MKYLYFIFSAGSGLSRRTLKIGIDCGESGNTPRRVPAFIFFLPLTREREREVYSKLR